MTTTPHHSLEPVFENLHGYFSRDRAPILHVKPGETVRYRTLDAGWREVDKTTGDLIRHKDWMDAQPLSGHSLVGPIEIEGAKKGMTLAVHIGDIIPATKGWNLGGGIPDWDHFVQLSVEQEPMHMVIWTIDTAAGIARNEAGFGVQLNPFMGVLGMPPDEPGNHPTAPPRYCGGNIDCKELVPGTTLYLPVTVDGGLFSVGDGHAVQGDGESSGTAIECAMERCDLTFDLLPDMRITTPRAKTPDGWLTFGVHEDLDEATMIALNAMLDLIMDEYRIDRRDALSLASLVVDLRVTQIVNGVKGIHAVLPDGAIQR